MRSAEARGTGVAVTVPAGAVVPVFVPAATALKVSYSKAPTWTVAGH